MERLHYIKEDLVKLHLSRTEFKLHACNAVGKWGRGIAAAFRDAYPKDYEEYQAFCSTFKDYAYGRYMITSKNIICLITSYHYSPADAERYILTATRAALSELAIDLPKNVDIYSNRFNSGLFSVPWENTEVLIKSFLERRTDINWTVCDL